MRRLMILIVIAGWAVSAHATPIDSLFQEGNQLLEAGDARGALATYEAIEAAGWTSVSLHLNASLAALRAGEVATARLHSERARALAPSNGAVREHAESVRRMTADPTTTRREAVVRQGWRLSQVLSPLLVLVVIALASTIVTAVWSLHVLRPSSNRKTLPVAFGASVLGFMLLVVIGLTEFARDHPPAVLSSGSSELRSAPGHASPTAEALNEGALVRVGSSRGEWRRVVTADGSRGWVEEAALQFVWR